jgi:ArsR family transcriptional regulator, repressor of sdpIR and other operons
MNKIYKSLANDNRKKIINLLTKNDLSVNEIVSNFSISQATISSHLSYLRSAGLVDFLKKGKTRIYFLKKSVLFRFIKTLNDEYNVFPLEGDDLEKNYFDNVERR